MENPNRRFFREEYSKRWLANQTIREHNRWHQEYQQITLDKLKCCEGNRVLECGSGSGELIQRLHDSVPNLKTTGIDLGRENLEWAQSRLVESQDVYLVEGDIGLLPFPDAVFDRVFASSVLWYIPDPRPAIHEMMRVLKPGGRFVFDVRNPFHVTNVLARVSLMLRRWNSRSEVRYSFFTPKEMRNFLQAFPVEYEIDGYFVLLPTRLPVLGKRFGNWARLSPWLSFEAGHHSGQWMALKLLVSGQKKELA